jgi:hypothetical protein
MEQIVMHVMSVYGVFKSFEKWRSLQKQARLVGKRLQEYLQLQSEHYKQLGLFVN